MPSGGSPSGGGSSTVTQVQQIPQYQQDMSQHNEQIAQSIAAMPYPTYDAQLIAGFSPQQQAGMDQAATAATSYQPGLTAATNTTNSAPGSYAPFGAAAAGMAAGSTSPWTAATAQQYMSPYAAAALAPQQQALALQQMNNQKGIDRQATQAGAFGDARQGVESSLNNFYGNLASNDLMSQGMNSAYSTGLQAFQTGQQQQLNAANALNNVGTTAANVNLATGQQQLANATAQQNLGLTGANANYNAGTQQQQLSQEQLTQAYNNFMNQTNWPIAMLNLQMSALANSPYTNTNYTTLAPSNASAQNLGAFASLAGGLGSLFGGGSSGGGSGVFSGSTYSDRRLKQKVVRIGKLVRSNLPLYTFEYIGDATKRIGVMADEVAKVMPDAVVIDNHSGFMKVDYGMVASHG